jgi:glycine cleavage system H protein
MSNPKNDSYTFKDVVIVGGLTLLAVSLLPLIAVLGLAFQFVFVAIAPVALIGTVAYALVTRAEPVMAVIRGIEMPSDVLFWRGHSWARKVSSRCVVVGVDDFAQRLIGPVEHVTTVEEGQKLQAGHVMATIERDGRSIPVPAPISGVVTKVNPQLGDEPGVVNGSPYGRGWLVEIDPDPTPSLFAGLRRGGKAMRWMRREVDRLVMLVQGPVPVASLPDGGELVTDVSSTVDDETWNGLVAAFFE